MIGHARLSRAERGESARATPLRCVRLRRRCALTAAGFALLGTTIVAPPRPRLVWNGSASAPIGLYAVTPGGVFKRGDMVVVWAPSGMRRLAAARRYLPIDVPLVKRIAALRGDRVCASGTTILIERTSVAVRRRHDRAGRTMPWWHGCVTLRSSMVFLLNEAPASFDGRYFGPTSTQDIIGKATPLWVG